MGMVNSGYKFKPIAYGRTDPIYKFSSSADETSFKSLSNNQSLTDGQYFGDYAVVKSGGDFIPPGYEKVGDYQSAGNIYSPWQALQKDKFATDWFRPNLQIVKKKEAPPPAVPATPAAPIKLPTESTPTSSPSSKSTAVSSSDPPAQDFKLDEQAAAQRSYLDDTLTKRMEKFQNLLNSLTL